MRFYHVTGSKNLERIRHDGLRARTAPWWSGRKVFLWDKLSSARFYATSPRLFGGKPVILRLDVKKDDAFPLHPGVGDGIWFTRNDIPARSIHIVR